MMVASDADDAWCPPTFSESSLSRTWLALCTVQLASQRTLRSSSERMSSLVGMNTLGRCRSSRLAGPYMSRSRAGGGGPGGGGRGRGGGGGGGAGGGGGGGAGGGGGGGRY